MLKKMERCYKSLIIATLPMLKCQKMIYGSWVKSRLKRGDNVRVKMNESFILNEENYFYLTYN